MPRERITAQQRRSVIERAQGCCEYCWCQVDFATQSFSVEHIVAVNHGGTNTLDNLALVPRRLDDIVVHVGSRRRVEASIDRVERITETRNGGRHPEGRIGDDAVDGA